MATALKANLRGLQYLKMTFLEFKMKMRSRQKLSCRWHLPFKRKCPPGMELQLVTTICALRAYKYYYTPTTKDMARKGPCYQGTYPHV